MNTFCTKTTCTLNTSKNEIAAFVPIQIFLEPLQLVKLKKNKNLGLLRPSLINNNLENLKNISNENFETQPNVKKLNEYEETSKIKLNNTNLSEDIYLPEEHSHMCDRSIKKPL